MIRLGKSCMKLLIPFGVNILISIIGLILLTVTNLSGVAKIFAMVIVIRGIKNSLYHAPKYLVLELGDQLQKFLGYSLQIVHEVMLKKSRKKISSSQWYL